MVTLRVVHIYMWIKTWKLVIILDPNHETLRLTKTIFFSKCFRELICFMLLFWHPCWPTAYWREPDHLQICIMVNFLFLITVILGIYPEIAVCKYEHWSSLAPLPFEVVISAGQKAKEESQDRGQLSFPSHFTFPLFLIACILEGFLLCFFVFLSYS